MAILKSLFPSSSPVQENKAEDEKVLLLIPEPAILGQEETKMDLSKVLTYTTSKKGVPATWSCGKATISAPKLKAICAGVQALSISPEGKSNFFLFQLDKQAGKAGKTFLEALDLKEIPYLEVVSHVLNHQVQKGRAAGTGVGKSGKVVKVLAKAIAMKYPAATSQEVLFMSLLNFIENMDNQEAIYKAFSEMSKKNGTDEKGMIQLRVMTPEQKKAAADRMTKRQADKKTATKKAK
jgi:hypothetical protein